MAPDVVGYVVLFLMLVVGTSCTVVSKIFTEEQLQSVWDQLMDVTSLHQQSETQALAARAERQHRLWLENKSEGLYGSYPPAIDVFEEFWAKSDSQERPTNAVTLPNGVVIARETDDGLVGMLHRSIQLSRAQVIADAQIPAPVVVCRYTGKDRMLCRCAICTAQRNPHVQRFLYGDSRDY
ncbi:hypothetical protein [Mycolicibacter kumamotonensis]|uniref:Uncharacterized protein n=1 Tax=Mycolicibacter kumamotonensis TaxID=354243 RepID=A0A1B8SL28_9MYCO|nr:hypothetical protein [Mycolicibacter kumamotonensis]OBY33449.1 hypothetical protein ACT18_00415 [Mycolicibacter kumamotonensis]